MQRAEKDVPPSNYDELFNAYSHTIFTYLLLHAPSREEAEDITLDVFTSSLSNQGILLWDAPRQLGWLKRVASNKLTDYYRRSSRRPAVALDHYAETLFDEHDPEQLAVRKEDYAHLHSHIQQLPPLQQQLLHLRYGHGRSTAEIAELFNKSDHAVRQMLSRTISLLREMYKGKKGASA